VNALREEERKREAAASVGGSSFAGVAPATLSSDTPLTWPEAEQYFSTLAIQDETRSRVVMRDFRHAGVLRRMAFWFRPPRLSSAARTREVEQLFALALCPLDYEQMTQERALKSLFRTLTNDSHGCPRIASHWEEIGFQGRDPATDLRGGGLLGLVQLLSLVRQQRAMAQRVHRLSRDDRQSFPFAVVSLNFTGVVLKLLRDCTLYSELNRSATREQSVMLVANRVHAALVYHFYLLWKNGGCTIVDFSRVKEVVEHDARSRLAALLEQLDKSEDGLRVAASGGAPLEFTEIP
jgi:ELMO domain-containing protein